MQFVQKLLDTKEDAEKEAEAAVGARKHGVVRPHVFVKRYVKWSNRMQKASARVRALRRRCCMWLAS